MGQQSLSSRRSRRAPRIRGQAVPALACARGGPADADRMDSAATRSLPQREHANTSPRSTICSWSGARRHGREPVDGLFRAAHSLKGMAASMGYAAWPTWRTGARTCSIWCGEAKARERVAARSPVPPPPTRWSAPVAEAVRAVTTRRRLLRSRPSWTRRSAAQRRPRPPPRRAHRCRSCSPRRCRARVSPCGDPPRRRRAQGSAGAAGAGPCGDAGPVERSRRRRRR